MKLFAIGDKTNTAWQDIFDDGALAGCILDWRNIRSTCVPDGTLHSISFNDPGE